MTATTCWARSARADVVIEATKHPARHRVRLSPSSSITPTTLRRAGQAFSDGVAGGPQPPCDGPNRHVLPRELHDSLHGRPAERHVVVGHGGRLDGAIRR